MFGTDNRVKLPAFFVFFVCLFFCKVEAQTSILFCGGVENDRPIGVSDRYYPDSAGTFLYAYYEQQEPLAMKQVGMELYKKNGENFDLLSERQLYTVKPKWKYTYIKCRFNAPGFYKVKIYDENAKLLGEGMVIIM